MYRDAHGKPFGNKSDVVLFDLDVQYDSEEFESFVEGHLAELQKNRSLFATEIDIGGGADWPVIAIELLENYIPHAAILAVFFSGDRVLKNLKAWKELAQPVLKAFPKLGFGNRNAAAALLLGKISENFDGAEVKLLAYESFDRELLRHVDVKATHDWIVDKMQSNSTVELDDYKVCHGPPIHAFKLLLDGSVAVVVVEGSSVALYGN